MTSTRQDPRPAYVAAQDWFRQLLELVPPDRWGAPTALDFTVSELVGHSTATLDRAAAIAAGLDPMTQPRFVEEPAAGPAAWPTVFAEHLPAVRAAWTPELLEATVIAPPGIPVPGRVALLKYASELFVHGWDLARALDLPSEAPSAPVELVLADAEQIVPAAPRGGFVPFDAVVPSAPGAGPTERLANWNGRVSRA